jgi:hypothetical protein
MAKRAATDGESASGRCWSGMFCFLRPALAVLPLAWAAVFEPEARSLSGEGTSTGWLGGRMVCSCVCSVGCGGVDGLLKACDR